MSHEPGDEPPPYPRLTAILGENAVTEIQDLVSDAIEEHESSGDIAADSAAETHPPTEQSGKQ